MVKGVISGELRCGSVSQRLDVYYTGNKMCHFVGLAETFALIANTLSSLYPSNSSCIMILLNHTHSNTHTHTHSHSHSHSHSHTHTLTHAARVHPAVQDSLHSPPRLARRTATLSGRWEICSEPPQNRGRQRQVDPRGVTLSTHLLFPLHPATAFPFLFPFFVFVV